MQELNVARSLRPHVLVLGLLALSMPFIGPAASALNSDPGSEAKPPRAVRASYVPNIAGRPITQAPRDTLYVFQPQTTAADGDCLKFSILNKPQCTWFDARTGALTELPEWAQSGRTFAGVVIRGSDGTATRALPTFDIEVGKNEGGGNASPTISGIPATRATVGKNYSFTPKATDRNGDLLTFSILNKPAWARFAADTGTLSGTPTQGSVGTHGNILIRVADRKTIASLQPFSITVIAPDDATHDVTLTWTTPTRNTDGSALTDLAGYQVLYGVAPGQYSQAVQVRGAEIQSVELQDLASGTWYFAIRSVNRAGIESAHSEEVSAVL